MTERKTETEREREKETEERMTEDREEREMTRLESGQWTGIRADSRKKQQGDPAPKCENRTRRVEKGGRLEVPDKDANLLKD